ncbi:hypothetical protein pipiens_016796 [Culex pipiens pipiens]|uniref:Uncharacterized protein n=1 Tax=Culex pipiens pipiens TaxID=38569 RepID=A0ABD1CJU1_CULPP
MESYVFKLRPDGIHIVILGRTWEKLLLAMRCIVSIEYPDEVFAFSSRQFGKRFVLRFGNYTESAHIAGRFTSEVSYVNIPVFSFGSDSLLKFVHIAIPCNTKSPHFISLM